MGLLSFITSIFHFLSFLSGTVFGVLICLAAALHFLTGKPDEDENKPAPASTIDPNSVFAGDESARPKDMRTALTPETAMKLSPDTEKRLNSIIEYLEEVNAPMKGLASILQKVHQNKDEEISNIEGKMKTIIDFNTIARIEKDFSDNMNKLKDFTKQLKLVTNFMNDMGKTFNSFSQNLSKLANNAKSNMNRNNSQLEHKEDLIVNSWWQLMQTTLEHTAGDQYEFGYFVSDELCNHSQQVLEEISLIEKRLYNEGNRQFNQIREHIALFESKLREREKSREKVKSSSLTSMDGHQKRLQKVKQSEEALVVQTKRLYEVQKEFFQLIPRITSDVQLTILKAIVETQSQLSKLTEGMERAQQNNRSICKKMKLQLTNAAASMLQMIRSENRLLEESKDMPSIALETIRNRMEEAGVQGYEMSLQKVLEGLLLQSQLKEVSIAFDQSNGNKSGGETGRLAETSNPYLASKTEVESAGKLNMFKESSACLAASNPGLLPEIPRIFNRAIGVETCIWFNAFSGRVYRDIANSEYFYYWFCGKLAQMLNKREKERPAYIDSFQVTDVKFGELPPLLMNVKWSPYLKKKNKTTTDGNNTAKSTKGGMSEKKDYTSSTPSKMRNTFAQNPMDDDEEDEDNAESEESDEELDENGQRRESFSENPADQYDNSDPYYYAACTADMAFRSGIKFTVSTKFWLNWPRDRYASVPVIFHLDLAEMTGRIRFGVTRNYSFITFLRDPTTRINVRSEVGGDKYKLKDIPQVSDYIVKKLKSFIHKKIVHPHCHKFRLIWPRNWWPKGTENFFVGVPVNIPSSVMQNLETPITGEGISVPIVTATTLPVNASEKLSSLSTTNTSNVASSNNNASTYQFNDYASDVMMASSKTEKYSKAEASTNRSSSPSNINNLVDDMTSSTKSDLGNLYNDSTPSKENNRPSMKDSPTAASNAKKVGKELLSKDQLDIMWHKHLRSAAIKMDLASFNHLGAGISDTERNFHLKAFYKYQKALPRNANNDKDNNASSMNEKQVMDMNNEMLTMSGVSDDSSPATVVHHNNTFHLNPNVRLKRSYSIGDFRGIAMEAVLDKMLSNMNHSLQDYEENEDVDSEQRSAFSFQMNNRASSETFPTQEGSQHIQKLNRAASAKSAEDDHNQLRTRPRGRSDAQQLEYRNSSSGPEEFSTAWLKARGKESMARAKAQFSEFKSKHFKSQTEKERESISSTSNTTATSTPNTTKRTSIFGDKLKDLLSINEDSSEHSKKSAPTRRDSGTLGTSTSNTVAGNNTSTGSSRLSMFAKAMSSMRQHIEKDNNSHAENLPCNRSLGSSSIDPQDDCREVIEVVSCFHEALKQNIISFLNHAYILQTLLKVVIGLLFTVLYSRSST